MDAEISTTVRTFYGLAFEFERFELLKIRYLSLLLSFTSLVTIWYANTQTQFYLATMSEMVN